jgi:hypothetical protein
MESCEYKMVFGKPKVKTPLTRPRRRWEDNIKIDPEETVCGCELSLFGWVPVFVALMNMVLFLNVLQKGGEIF